MRVTFLGTGTSTGVPVIGCDCATCRSTDGRDRRWRPSVYLQLDNDLSVLIDASPDLRAQALRFDVRRVDMILFTHGHADHVLGLDDVRIYNFRQRGVIPCFGDARTLAGVRRMFAYVFDPSTPRGGGLPQLALWPVSGPFSVAGRTIVPVPLRHGTLPVFGYRLGALAYLTDCNAIPDASWPLLEGLDVLVLDALRQRPHSTHFNVEQAVEAAVPHWRPADVLHAHDARPAARRDLRAVSTRHHAGPRRARRERDRRTGERDGAGGRRAMIDSPW